MKLKNHAPLAFKRSSGICIAAQKEWKVSFMRKTGLIGLLLIPLFFSHSLKCRAAEASSDSAEGRQEVIAQQKRNCRRIWALLATGAIGLGITGIVVSPVGRGVSHELSLENIKDRLGGRTVASSTPEIRALYGKMIFRDFLKSESNLTDLYRIMTSHTASDSVLAARAAELGIPLSSDVDFYTFLGVAPVELRPGKYDKVGVNISPSKWVPIDFGINMDDMKEAMLRARDTDSFRRMDAFFATWIDQEFERRSHDPSVTLSAIRQRLWQP